jgi:hypothetical protein
MREREKTVLLQVGIAPCDKCGRDIITDQQHGGWYFGSGCADIHGDGCDGHADESKARTEETDIY